MARNVLKCGRKAIFYQNIKKRLNCISSSVVRQNVSELDFLLFYCFWKKKKIRVCVFAHTCMQIWKDNKSSEMLLPITYCKFSLGIMKSVNSLSSSPFPLWYFLYFPPPSGSFNVLIVWKKFFCYLLWSSSDIKFTFEGQRMYQKFLYYLSC